MENELATAWVGAYSAARDSKRQECQQAFLRVMEAMGVSQVDRAAMAMAEAALLRWFVVKTEDDPLVSTRWNLIDQHLRIVAEGLGIPASWGGLLAQAWRKEAGGLPYFDDMKRAVDLWLSIYGVPGQEVNIACSLFAAADSAICEGSYSIAVTSIKSFFVIALRPRNRK